MKFSACTALLVVAALGCSPSTSTVRHEPTTRPTAAHAHAAGLMGSICPMEVEGTTARAVEVQGGVALDFETTGDVAKLRNRVRRMADMQRRGDGMMIGGAMIVPAPLATVENTPRGARMILRPHAESQLLTLRDQARMEAARMNHGECPMMSTAATA